MSSIQDKASLRGQLFVMREIEWDYVCSVPTASLASFPGLACTFYSYSDNSRTDNPSVQDVRVLVL